MSSHWEWAKGVVAKHDLGKPFAPENGDPLKFKIGDPVIFTNDYGVSFRLRITGYYQPTDPCPMYATGSRYLVDSSSPWFPVKESELQLDEDDRADLKGSVDKHDWAIGIKCEDGYPVFVDDCQLSYRLTQQAAKQYALALIERLQADGDYRLDDKPRGFLPPALSMDAKQFQRISERLLEKHYGLSLNDMHLCDEKIAQECINQGWRPFEVVA